MFEYIMNSAIKYYNIKVLDGFEDYNCNVSDYQYCNVRFKADENIVNL